MQTAGHPRVEDTPLHDDNTRYLGRKVHQDIQTRNIPGRVDHRRCGEFDMDDFHLHVAGRVPINLIWKYAFNTPPFPKTASLYCATILAIPEEKCLLVE